MMATVSSPPVSLSIERPALYVVATPIGNLADLSHRAQALLASADLLLVEDTRVTQKLLLHYAITNQLVSLHEHNETRNANAILSRIVEENLGVALLSDAGTPLVADPGYRVVKAARDCGVPVYTLPGPCAAIAALSIAGIPSDRFVFEGFLPSRSAARRTQLAEFIHETRTVIFYEAPHRILATMEDLCDVVGGERDVSVGRELTKLHETQYQGHLRDVTTEIRNDPNAVRGEIVIVLGGTNLQQTDKEEHDALKMVAALRKHLSTREAIKVVVEITGVKRNRLYRLLHSRESDVTGVE